jgi:hypothetical protein
MCGFQPLNKKHNSQWQTFFKNKEIITAIERDVRRTLPYLNFFHNPSPSSPSSEENTSTKNKPSHQQNEGQSRFTLSTSIAASSSVDVSEIVSESNPHYVALKRLLFLWAKLNPGINYVQGMNEIVAPIYYVFATDRNPEWCSYAEEDTFFCFTNLMSEIRDNFCKTLDTSRMGIAERISQFSTLLQQKDPQLWEDLVHTSMSLSFSLSYPQKDYTLSLYMYI